MWEFLQQIGVPAAFVLVFLYVFLKEILPLVVKSKTEVATPGTDPAVIAKLDEIKRSLKAVLINQRDDRAKLDKVEKNCTDLRDCHLGAAARDSTGGYRWYMRAEALEALEKNLEQIARHMEAETKVLTGFIEQLKRLSILP